MTFLIFIDLHKFVLSFGKDVAANQIKKIYDDFKFQFESRKKQSPQFHIFVLSDISTYFFFKQSEFETYINKILEALRHDPGVTLKS